LKTLVEAKTVTIAKLMEIVPADTLTIDSIANQTEGEGFKLKSLIRKVIQSDSFLQSN